MSQQPVGRRRVVVLVLLAALVVVVGWLGRQPIERATVELRRTASETTGVHRVEGHADILRAAAAETGIDPNLLAGIMFVESKGRLDAVSDKGALGLFQLMPRTAEERAVLLGLPEVTADDLVSDGALNARLAAHQLAWLIRRYKGDVEAALVAYNAGPGKLERWIRERGSYAAWRDSAEYSGRSDVLRYARNVLAWRERFARRGAVAPAYGPPIPPLLRRELPAGESGPPPPPDEHEWILVR